MTASVAPHRLRCIDCGSPHEPSLATECPACGGLFTVEYLSDADPAPIPYEPFSLGEGGTPTLSINDERMHVTGQGDLRLELKLEYLAPTGSFKDRGSAMLIAAARAHGIDEFVEDSSGNAGASLAAYAAAAGIRAHIFLPADASPAKFAQLDAVGASIHAAPGPRSAAARAARAFVRERSLPYLSHNLSPYFGEGMKAAAAEIAAHGAPNAIVLPVGNGSLLLGLRRGFDELRRAKAIRRAPRLYAVQSDSVAPLVAALQGRATRQARPTIASGAAVDDPPRLNQMLTVLRESGGGAISVSELEIGAAHRMIARMGIHIEPTSALPLAALPHLRARRLLGAAERVLLPLTGAGWKS